MESSTGQTSGHHPASFKWADSEVHVRWDGALPYYNLTDVWESLGGRRALGDESEWLHSQTLRSDPKGRKLVTTRHTHPGVLTPREEWYSQDDGGTWATLLPAIEYVMSLQRVMDNLEFWLGSLEFIERSLKAWSLKPVVHVTRNPVQGTYFVEGADLVKIGKSADLSGRFAALSTGSPVPLKFLGAIPRDVESILHGKYVASRSHGEWFKKTPELMSFIENETFTLMKHAMHSMNVSREVSYADERISHLLEWIDSPEAYKAKRSCKILDRLGIRLEDE